MPASPPPSDKLRELLRGFPEPVVEACAEFQATKSAGSFERALAGIIQHHLTTPPAVPVSEISGTTRLVADLGLDSLTMVEMAFLFEDVFGEKVPHEEFVQIVTLDDLRTLLRARLGIPPQP